MGNWKNNLSYGYTWLTLMRLKQVDVVFNDSKDVKMSQLAFYNQLVTQDALRTEALNLANTMDTTFRIGMGARFEQGKSQDQAIASMVEILMDANKTIEDLAVKNDEYYLFMNEQG